MGVYSLSEDRIHFQNELTSWQKLHKNHNVIRRFLGGIKTTFYGGSGDSELTFHEYLFSVMFPEFKQQVVFGTGKGGYKKYGVYRYTADFYHEPSQKICEVNGKSHFSKASKDYNRALFFLETHGIETINLYHDDVEELYYAFKNQKESYENWRCALIGESP